MKTKASLAMLLTSTLLSTNLYADSFEMKFKCILESTCVNVLIDDLHNRDSYTSRSYIVDMYKNKLSGYQDLSPKSIEKLIRSTESYLLFSSNFRSEKELEESQRSVTIEMLDDIFGVEGFVINEFPHDYVIEKVDTENEAMLKVLKSYFFNPNTKTEKFQGKLSLVSDDEYLEYVEELLADYIELNADYEEFLKNLTWDNVKDTTDSDNLKAIEKKLNLAVKYFFGTKDLAQILYSKLENIIKEEKNADSRLKSNSIQLMGYLLANNALVDSVSRDMLESFRPYMTDLKFKRLLVSYSSIRNVGIDSEMLSYLLSSDINFNAAATWFKHRRLDIAPEKLQKLLEKAFETNPDRALLALVGSFQSICDQEPVDSYKAMSRSECEALISSIGESKANIRNLQQSNYPKVKVTEEMLKSALKAHSPDNEQSMVTAIYPRMVSVGFYPEFVLEQLINIAAGRNVFRNNDISNNPIPSDLVNKDALTEDVVRELAKIYLLNYLQFYDGKISNISVVGAPSSYVSGSYSSFDSLMDRLSKESCSEFAPCSVSIRKLETLASIYGDWNPILEAFESIRPINDYRKGLLKKRLEEISQD